MSLKTGNTINTLSNKKMIQIAIILLIVLNFDIFLNWIKFVYGIISPILWGVGIAFVLNIIVVKYEKIYFPNSKNKFILRTRRVASILFTFLTIILVISLLLYIVIPQIKQSIQSLSTDIPGTYERVVEWIKQTELYPILKQTIEGTEGIDISDNKSIEKIWEPINNWAFSSIGAIFGGITKFVLALVLSIYILFDKKVLINNYRKLANTYLNKDKRERLSKVFNTAEETFSCFFIGQFKEAMILGFLCTIGMLILRLPYAVTIGSVVGLFALIPLIGAYLGAAFGLLVIIVVNPYSAIVFFIFIMVLQQLEGTFIYPKIVGTSIKLPGTWVFATIIVGGSLMGVIGILLGIPLIATIYKLLHR